MFILNMFKRESVCFTKLILRKYQCVLLSTILSETIATHLWKEITNYHLESMYQKIQNIADLNIPCELILFRWWIIAFCIDNQMWNTSSYIFNVLILSSIGVCTVLSLNINTLKWLFVSTFLVWLFSVQTFL